MSKMIDRVRRLERTYLGVVGKDCMVIPTKRQYEEAAVRSRARSFLSARAAYLFGDPSSGFEVEMRVEEVGRRTLLQDDTDEQKQRDDEIVHAWCQANPDGRAERCPEPHLIEEILAMYDEQEGQASRDGAAQ